MFAMHLCMFTGPRDGGAQIGAPVGDRLSLMLPIMRLLWLHESGFHLVGEENDIVVSENHRWESQPGTECDPASHRPVS